MVSKKIIFLFLILFSFFILSCKESDSGIKESKNYKKDVNMINTVEFLSQTYSMNRIYKSMEGPSSMQKVSLVKDGEPELLWITGYRTVVVGPDGKTPINQEFMCHNNLDVDLRDTSNLIKLSRYPSSRTFTLSQGQFSIEFPEGFGLPVMSNEVFKLSTQVLNHNEKGKEIEVRHKVLIDYIRDKDLEEPLKPLMPTNAFVMAALTEDNSVFGILNPDESMEGTTCLPGEHAKSAKEQSIYTDRLGRQFSGHWVVKPGEETRHTRVTETLRLPYDTTIHYIAIHAHPFAEWMELRDITAGDTIFRTNIEGPKDRIGITNIQEYKSIEGVNVYKDHEYDLVSYYNNTSGVDQDAMATMFIYLLDKEFKKPVLKHSPNINTKNDDKQYIRSLF